MLRASAEHQSIETDLTAVTTGCGDCGLGDTDDLLALTDAIVLGDMAEYPDARVRAELAFGRDGADRIAMIAANFGMMNRLMDAVGGPVGEASVPLAAELGVTIPPHLLGAQ